MTEEIKEKLEAIASNDDIDLLWNEANDLLNYITNLQKENEKLKEDIEDISVSHFSCFKRYDDYKSRNEKASDFILSKVKEYKPHFAKVELNTADCNELLNILEGGDE